MTENENIVSKIQALLAKAERTDNEHESEAFFAKAQSLIVKYAVEQWQLTPEEREKIILKKIDLSPKRADYLLLNAVARANSVEFVVGAAPRSRGRRGYLTGYPSDIAFVESLTASLLLQRERELERAQAHKPSWEHGKAFNHSFRVAYANKINARLKVWKADAFRDAGTGTELVLADKFAQVQQFTADQLGVLRKSTSISSRSAIGEHHGRNAADRADISGGERNLGNSKLALE